MGDLKYIEISCETAMNKLKRRMPYKKKEVPHLYNDLLILYKSGGANKEYKNSLYKIVNERREKYNLSSSYTKPMKEKLYR